MGDATNIWDAGARRLERAGRGLGASIWEFQPGEPEYVYHFHHGSDELLVVLRGRAEVATTRRRADIARGRCRAAALRTDDLELDV